MVITMKLYIVFTLPKIYYEIKMIVNDGKEKKIKLINEKK